MRDYLKEKRRTLIVQLIWIAAFAVGAVLLRERNPGIAKLSLVFLAGGLYSLIDSFLRWRAHSKLGEANAESWNREEYPPKEDHEGRDI